MARKFSLDKNQIFSLFLKLGTTRSLYQLYAELNKIGGKLPCEETIRLWAKNGDWFTIARAHDDEVKRKLMSQNVDKEVQITFNARADLETGASKILTRLNTFLTDDAKSVIANWDEAKIAHDLAISAIRLAEVLRGGEVDRKALEESKTVDEVEDQLDEEFRQSREDAKQKVLDFVERQKKAAARKAGGQRASA